MEGKYTTTLNDIESISKRDCTKRISNNTHKESDVQKTILDYIERIGGYAIRTNSGSLISEYKGKTRRIRLGRKGTPDIVCCIKGKFVAIEVKKNTKEVEKRYKEAKSKTGNRSSDQLKQLQSITKKGGIAMCVGSLQEVIEILESSGII